MSHRSHPGPPFTVPAVSVILFFEESICSPGLKGHGLSGPFQLYSKRCRSWLIHVFLPLRSLLTPDAFFIFFHRPRSCRCFMLWDQQIHWFSVFWATHHFPMCPKCKVSYVSKMQRHMVNNIFVSHVSMCFNQEIYMPCSSGTATIFPVTQHSLGIQEIWIVKVLNDFFLCSWPSGLSKS